MASPSTVKLEHELLEKVALLSPAQKREALDFVTFIATRRRAKSKSAQGRCPLDAIVDLAAECKDTDLSVNHDKYLYGDDPL